MQASSFAKNETCSAYNKISQGTRKPPNSAYRSALRTLIQGLGGAVDSIPYSRCTMPSDAQLASKALPHEKKLQRRQRVVAHTCATALNRQQADEGLRGVLAGIQDVYAGPLKANIKKLGATGSWAPKVIDYMKFESACIQQFADTRCAKGYNPAAYPSS